MNPYNSFKSIRLALKLTQSEMAQKLGLTQASVSRLESGRQTLTPELFDKIQNIFSNEISLSQLNAFKNDLNKNVEKPRYIEQYSELPGGWSYFSYTKMDQLQNGDLLKLKSNRAGKTAFIFGDMTGHGNDAAYMAVSMLFGFEVVLSLVSFNFVSSEFLNSILSSSINKTKELWKDNPSLIIGTINSSDETLEFINQGMPYPILLKDKKSHILQRRYSAIEKNSYFPKPLNPEVLKLGNQESLIFFSDGILDILNDSELYEFVSNQLAFFNGDSQALGINLVKKISHKISSDSDDVSIFIISRR